MNKYFISIIFIAFLLGARNKTITAQVWSRSFTAGNLDSKNNLLGGSEVLHLVSHKNKLFASVGYWEDENNIWYGGSNLNLGWGQIIRLDNSDAQWQEDHFLGASYLRPEILKQVVFNNDVFGDPMDIPDTLLIAAAYSQNFITNKVKATSFTRDDSDGTWHETEIYHGGFPAGENYSIRDIEIYTDKITGIENIYISIGTKGIFKGKYNPSTPGKIDWIPTPEIGPLSIRSLGITISNGTLYFSSGYTIYKRNDGFSPTYSIAHDFSDLSTNINSAVGGIRGLTNLANPNNNNEALLLMWCPDGQSKGVIYRLEPDGNEGFNRFYESKFSSLVESYLPGSNVKYLLGGYNEFYEYVDPITSDIIHLIGFEANINGGGYPTWNDFYKGALFAIRDANMQYSLHEVNDAIGINDKALVANRCYVKSPFANEKALYFGGFDPNGKTATNMAWIFKQDYQTSSTIEPILQDFEFSIYPNPAVNFLNVKFKSNDCLQYEILTTFGEILATDIVCPNEHIIDISELTPSAYLLKVRGKLYKFIKSE